MHHCNGGSNRCFVHDGDGTRCFSVLLPRCGCAEARCCRIAVVKDAMVVAVMEALQLWTVMVPLVHCVNG